MTKEYFREAAQGKLKHNYRHTVTMETSRKRPDSADSMDESEAGPSRPSKYARESHESSRSDILLPTVASYPGNCSLSGYPLYDLYSRSLLGYSHPYSQLPIPLHSRLSWMMSSLASSYENSEKYIIQKALQYADQSHRSAFSPVKSRSSCSQKNEAERVICPVMQHKMRSSLGRATPKSSLSPFHAETTERNTEGSGTEREVACHIYGILSLPGSKETRYPISPSELRRRVNSPECLNKVDMISYVRLAKTSARELLEKHNITTHLQTRRSRHTILSKMCEAECTALADGIFSLEMRYFPFKFVAFKMAEAMKCPLYPSETMAHMKIKDIEVTQSLLADLCYNLQSLATSEELTTFELISHTFGLRHIVSTLEFLITYYEELKKALASTSSKYK